MMSSRTSESLALHSLSHREKRGGLPVKPIFLFLHFQKHAENTVTINTLSLLLMTHFCFQLVPFLLPCLFVCLYRSTDGNRSCGMTMFSVALAYPEDRIIDSLPILLLFNLFFQSFMFLGP